MDIISLDEASAGPENDDFRDYIFNDQDDSITGGNYGTNAAQVYREHGPYQYPRSHSFWGRGYGPAGPPNQQSFPRESDTESFLLQCGVLKSTLKGLPKVLLRLMEPEYCGVCGHGFVNLDGARSHYISKNHGRNQKKWLAQQAKIGSKRPIEIPLRARELYCELCDIHITSKAHADSHYSGKLHRAIVEGRKFPKNPFLLQKNMQGRVEQLIRREKKSLKPTEKPVASATAQAVATSIPAELYCSICKASVTCTDQMTMHLNGKKHLLKEKRHIFKMMQGETTKPKPAKPVAAAKDTDAQDGADGWEKWETNNCQKDDHDWGHGSGTWDDDPQ